MTDDATALLRARIEALSARERGALAQSLDMPVPQGRSELVAYVTATGVEPRIEDLQALVRSRLPEYMVPDRFVFVEALPRTATGKLDRRALARPSDALESSDEPAPEEPSAVSGPRNEAERILSDIWKAVLDTDEIDIHDDFFELGGDSILSIRIISRANQAGLKITPQQFFESPIIADLAAAAEGPEEGS
jgi:aryl carrier-like protein